MTQNEEIFSIIAFVIHKTYLIPILFWNQFIGLNFFSQEYTSRNRTLEDSLKFHLGTWRGLLNLNFICVKLMCFIKIFTEYDYDQKLLEAEKTYP